MKCPQVTDAMFPRPLDELVDACRDRNEAHPAAVVAQYIVALGNLIGPTAHTYVGETVHRTNENLLVVGPTSTGRKGDAWHAGKAPLKGVDPEWEANITGGLSSGEGLIYAVRDPVHGVDKKGETVLLDAGVEDKRLLVIETEFSSVLKMFERKGSILNNTIRDCWDSKEVLRTLTKESPARATGAHVSIIGHATPEDLRAHLDNLSIANGLANRFFLVASERLKRVPSPTRLPDDVRQRVADHARTVVTHADRVGCLHRTAAAERAWATIYANVSAEVPGLLGALLARGPAHLIRLSLFFAIFDLAPAIDLKHLAAACAWWDYSEASARLIFGNRTGNADADRIMVDMLVGQSMTNTEIREDIFRGKIVAARLTDALGLLRDLGEVDITHRMTGGRPAVVITRIERSATGATTAATATA